MPELKFQPCNERHSIEDFFLLIRFARQLSETTFANLVTQARSRAKRIGLPGEKQQQGMHFALDQFSGVSTQSHPLFGINFLRFDASGTIEEALILERNSIGYRTNKYERWEQIVNRLEDLILPLAEVFISEIPLINSAQIQYIDRFLAIDQAAVDWSSLFCSGTRWVASGMIDTKTAWHSHCGRFEASLASQASRRLINVNVDVGEPMPRIGLPPTNSLSVLTLCADHFLKPDVKLESFASEMRNHFDALHERSKEILSEVLHEDYLNRIGMKTGG